MPPGKKPLALSITDAAWLAGLVDGEGTISRAHHTPSHTYSIANRQALDILKQIPAYLQSCGKTRRARTERVRQAHAA